MESFCRGLLDVTEGLSMVKTWWPQQKQQKTQSSKVSSDVEPDGESTQADMLHSDVLAKSSSEQKQNALLTHQTTITNEIDKLFLLNLQNNLSSIL